MPAVHFLLRGGDQRVQQVVGLHAESLAAGDLDVGLGAVFRAHLVAQSIAQRGVSATIS